MHAVLRHLRRAVQQSDAPALTDGQLLDRFIRSRDEAAFAALVRRHGPMVLGVCRRIAGNVHDADDAFQAAFLVLVRKARAVVPREQVGNYLYGVAYHTALKARAAALRRRGKEKQVTVMPQPETLPRETEPDLLACLDAEVQRLPDKLRLPVVLCELEGRARKEVAAQLGIPEGTLSSRLAQARKRLARRLGGNGLVLGAAGATVAVSAALLQATVEAATLTAAGQATAEVVSANITLLTEGVLKTMYLAKLKVAAGVVLVLGMLGGGLLTGWYGSVMAAEPVPGQKAPKAEDAAGYNPFFAQAKPAPLPKKDHDGEILQGTWRIVAVSQTNHEPSAAEQKHLDAGEMSITFNGNKVVSPGGMESTLALDTSVTPKRLRLSARRGDLDVTVMGIYELNGDDLKICTAVQDDTDYPHSFNVQKAPEGKAYSLLTLRRVTPTKGNFTPPADVALIQGTWRVTALTHAGSDKPLTEEAAEQVHKRTFTFAADRMETSGGATGTYALDPETWPKRMTMTLASPSQPKQHYKAIYTIEGDDLVLCLAETGSDGYPPDFAVEKAKPEAHLTRYTLKRVDPKQTQLDRIKKEADAELAQWQAADLKAQLEANQANLIKAKAQMLLLENQLKQLEADRQRLEGQRAQLEDNLDRTKRIIDARDALKNATKGQSNDKALKTLDEMENLIQRMKKELKDKEDRK